MRGVFSPFYLVLITLTLLALRRPVFVVVGDFRVVLFFEGDESKSFLVDFVVFFVEFFFFEGTFLLDFLAANNSKASSIEIFSAVFPSGREAFTFPCFTYKPYGPLNN